MNTNSDESSRTWTNWKEIDILFLIKFARGFQKSKKQFNHLLEKLLNRRCRCFVFIIINLLRYLYHQMLSQIRNNVFVCKNSTRRSRCSVYDWPYWEVRGQEGPKHWPTGPSIPCNSRETRQSLKKDVEVNARSFCVIWSRALAFKRSFISFHCPPLLSW